MERLSENPFIWHLNLLARHQNSGVDYFFIFFLCPFQMIVGFYPRNEKENLIRLFLLMNPVEGFEENNTAQMINELKDDYS